MSRRFVCISLILLMGLSLVSVTTSASSQLLYSGAATNDEKSSTSNYVAVNHDNTIIAAAYSREVILFHASNYSVIDTLEFQRDVHDIEFSPNGSLLAITTVGVSVSEFVDSVIIYDVSDKQILPLKERANSVRSSISWTPDNNFLAVANFQNGVNLIEVDTMEVVTEYSNEHQSDVTCIAFSNNGQFVISGDKDGIVNLWNFDGTFSGNSFSLQGEITGCGFNSQDQRISATSIEGDISTWTVTGNLLHEKNINRAMGLQWSNTLDILYVLEYSNEPRLIYLDGSTFNELSSIYFIHKALDFDLNQLSNGVLSNIYVATDTNHVSNYAQPTPREGFGESGADLDGDNIPDSIDNDDDGDSFLDNWDFNCPEEITDCERNPDVNNIRNIDLRITQNTLIIEDTYTFGLSSSAEIRNLTRRAIISDQQVSYEESNLFENAVCKNMDPDNVIQSWRDNLELSVGQVVNGSLECIVISGLSFSGTFDPEGIKFTMRLVFDVIPNATLPLDLAINEQISFSDSSITHLVENHPIFVSLGDNAENNENQMWWKNEGSILLTFSEDEEVAKSLKVYNFVTDKTNLSVIIIIISGLIFVIIRRRNKITIDLDDDDDVEELDYEEDEDGYNNLPVDVNRPEPILSEERYLEHDDDSEELQFIKSEDTPVSRRAFVLDEEEKVPQIRRRTGKMDRNKHGPIMSTKRKRLGGDEKTSSMKPVNVRPVKKGLRTRKVKIDTTEINDDSISWELD